MRGAWPLLPPPWRAPPQRAVGLSRRACRSCALWQGDAVARDVHSMTLTLTTSPALTASCGSLMIFSETPRCAPGRPGVHRCRRRHRSWFTLVTTPSRITPIRGLSAFHAFLESAVLNSGRGSRRVFQLAEDVADGHLSKVSSVNFFGSRRLRSPHRRSASGCRDRCRRRCAAPAGRFPGARRRRPAGFAIHHAQEAGGQFEGLVAQARDLLQGVNGS